VADKITHLASDWVTYGAVLSDSAAGREDDVAPARPSPAVPGCSAALLCLPMNLALFHGSMLTHRCPCCSTGNESSSILLSA